MKDVIPTKGFGGGALSMMVLPNQHKGIGDSCAKILIYLVLGEN